MPQGNALPKKQTNRLPLMRNGLVQPFLKWAGGKRQLLPELNKLVPKAGFKRYFEPFVGAGAFLFDLQHRDVVINDFNAELINCYEVIRDEPEGLIKEVSDYPHSKEFFYQLREQDRNAQTYKELSSLKRAARIIYLNKTCFNGLFRVNSQGQFNVPFGDYTNPQVADPSIIRAISHYLNLAKIEILNGDFADAVQKAKKGDFVYFDPPYDPVSDTASFTGYSLSGFGRDQQERLKITCDQLSDRGCHVLVSNSATDFIKKLYADSRYKIIEVQALRNINSVGSGRSKISELLIHNRYDAKTPKK